LTDISITALGSRQFGVRVREGETETNHKVTVPESLLDDLQLGDDDVERVVRESFHFLLDREPASSILPEFSLNEISRYFPEYSEELTTRLA
jgi:hypothetical protein